MLQQQVRMRSQYLFSPVDRADSRRTFFLLATERSLSLFEIEKRAYAYWMLLFITTFAGGLFITGLMALLLGPFVGWSPAFFSITMLMALILIPTKTQSWTALIAFRYNQNRGASGLPVHVLETRFGWLFSNQLRIEAGGKERTLSISSRRRTLNSALELAGSPPQ